MFILALLIKIRKIKKNKTRHSLTGQPQGSAHNIEYYEAIKILFIDDFNDMKLYNIKLGKRMKQYKEHDLNNVKKLHRNSQTYQNSNSSSMVGIELWD